MWLPKCKLIECFYDQRYPLFWQSSKFLTWCSFTLRCPNWLWSMTWMNSYHIGETSACFPINCMVNAWTHPRICGSIRIFSCWLIIRKGFLWLWMWRVMTVVRLMEIACPQYFISSCKMWFLHQYHEFVLHYNSQIRGLCEISVSILTSVYSCPSGYAFIWNSYFQIAC